MRTTLATGCRTRRQRGFTLIEISIVVFILAILMAASVPSMVRSYNAAVLNDVVRGFGTTCQFARVKAITQQRPVVMHVDVKRQKFWIAQELGQPADDAETATVTATTLKVYALPKRVAMVSAARREASLAATSARRKPATESSVDQGIEFTFYPNGTCDGATVVFRGVEPKELLSVTVDPVTTRTAAFPVKS
jgi:type II secretion system protein H